MFRASTRAATILAAAVAAVGCASAPPPAPAAAPAVPVAACRATLVRFDPEPEGAAGLTEAGRLALKTLLTTDTFTSDAVGEGGEVPLQAECFRLLFREDAATAKAAFHHLADHGMAAGKLFGLCGLWFLDPEACAAGCDELAGEGDDFTVRVIEGCIAEERPVAGVVRRTSKSEPGAPDIRGGAWPKMLRGAETR